MAITSYYFGLGTGVYDGTGTTFTVAGKDFNPTPPTFTRSINATASGTAPTNLANYRYGHEIVVAVAVWVNNDAVNRTAVLDIPFVFPGGNNRIYSFGTQTLAANGGWYAGYAYAGIDYDEFTINGTASIGQRQGGSVIAAQNITYSNYDTSWNTTYSKSGALWIEGPYIYYIDNVYGDGVNGKKHRIDTDGSSSFVGTQYAGSIWVNDSAAKLSYVSEDGYKKSTYQADHWYGGPNNVGSNKKGHIWVSNGGATDGYGYLCFVSSTGNKFRIMNGPV